MAAEDPKQLFAFTELIIRKRPYGRPQGTGDHTGDRTRDHTGSGFFRENIREITWDFETADSGSIWETTQETIEESIRETMGEIIRGNTVNYA